LDAILFVILFVHLQAFLLDSMIFRFTDGDTVEVNPEELPELLRLNEEYLQNYLELADDLDDPSYVARGNGFCDTKYSEDFVESQAEKYRQRIDDIKQWMKLV